MNELGGHQVSVRSRTYSAAMPPICKALTMSQWRGCPAIGQMWELERAGPDEAFDMTSDIVAVDGNTAVARVEIHYGAPLNQQWRDVWIMRFAGDGRCDSFEEWPIAPPSRNTGD